MTVAGPLGNELQYTLDESGNPQVVTTLEQVAGGGTESYALETVFDGQDRPTVRRRYAQGVPVGSGTPLMTSFDWDSRSQLALVTDPIGRLMRTSYDLAGRPTSTVEDQGGLALTTGYVHDKDDLLTTLTDPDGKPTGWVHDALGRVREIDYALGGSELFTHDGEDAVVTHTRQDGVATALTYWPHGRLKSRTVGALREELDWAGVGVPREARVLVSGLVRSRVSRTFDGLGRVASESQDDFTVALTYDPSHNPVTVTWPDSTTLTQDFDELERLERIHEGPTDVAAWSWSGPGRVASRSTGQGLNLVTTYQWDPFQRLAGLDTGAVHDVAYGYDALDRRCWKQSQHLSGQPIDVYGYDGGSRLVDVWGDANAALCAQAPSGWASHLDLSLSPGEDRTQTSLDTGSGPVTTIYNSGAIDALHRYTNVGGTTRLHDAKGNLTSDGTLTYEYDAWNRLTAVKSGGTERARYEHDAFGRRTRKIEPTLETRYVYSGARLIAEYEDSGAGPVLARRYLHGVGLDELVALDSGGTRYFAFGDALGSVETLATAGGTKVELYRYDAFGSATVMNGSEVEIPLNSYNLPQSSLKNALWFTGARFDGESGHYHMRARQYEPKTGRFTGRDPLGYVDSANAYLYGFNDPANWVDPFGLEARSGPKRAWYQHAGDFLSGAALGLRDVAAGTFDALVVAPIDTVGMLASSTYTPVSMYSQHVGNQLAAGQSANLIGAKAAGGIVAAPVLVPWNAGWAIGQGINAGDAGQIGRGVGQLGGALAFAKGASALAGYGRGAGASTPGGRAAGGPRTPVEPARPGSLAEAVSGRNCLTEGAAGAAKGPTIGPKVQGQLAPRGWTPEAIQDAVQSGAQYPAFNKANGNPAIRYVHPETGQSVVVDIVTNQVIHVGGPGFKYGSASGDLK